MSNSVKFVQTEIMDFRNKSDGTKSIKRDIIMILILDGNSEHVAHALGQMCIFGERNPILTALDLTKSLQHIK